MRDFDYYGDDDEDLWQEVRFSKQAIRARATLTLYTALLTAPFIAFVACGAYLCGLQSHEVLGFSCYNTMLSSVFFFDTLRNAAHECFDNAQADGLVTCREGIPVIDPSCPHHRLARLSFAIGGRGPRRSS